MAQQNLDSSVKKLIESGASDEDIIFFMQNYKPTTETKPTTTPKSEPAPQTSRPLFKFPFAEKVEEAAAGSRAISPLDAFSSSIEAPGIREAIESVPSGMLPFKGLEKMVANFALSMAEGATSPAGAATAVMGGFPQVRAAAGGAFRRLAPGLADRILGKVPVDDAVTPALAQIGEQVVSKPRLRLTNDGNYINLDTGEVVGSVRPSKFEPLPIQEGESISDYIRRNGIDNIYTTPEEALANQAKAATAPSAPSAFIPPQFRSTKKSTNPEFDPKTLGFDKSDDKGRRGFSTTTELPLSPQEKARIVASTNEKKPVPGKLLNKEQLDPNIPITARKPEIPAEQSAFSQIWNTPRSLQSIDLPGITSAALRQSRPLAFTPSWFRAWNSALKSFSSKEALDSINQNIRNSVYFQPRYSPVMDKAGNITKYSERPSIAEELGVKMTDVINTREEAIVSSLAERIPGYGRYVKASNRAYTGFLNSLRKTKFEQLMDGARASGDDPETNLVLGKQIADFVNNATGRGSLKYFNNKINLEPVAQVLGNTLYSPRALSAKLAFVNPTNYTTAEPLVRNEYWKGLARIGTSWGAFTGLASLSPDVSVSLDANNSDFGKIRIGNTRIDPGAGWQQLMVLFHRELPQSLGGGGTTSSTGRPGQPGKFTPFGSNPMAATRLSLPGRYVYNQLNPSLRFVFDMLSATSKEPLDLTDRSLQMLLPMYAEDIAKAAEDDSATAEFFAPLLSSMGAGVQNYERGSFNKPQITPSIEKATGVKVPTVKVGR